MSHVKRLMRELALAEKNNAEDNGIYLVQENDDNMYKLLALIIGPLDTIYDGGFFLFRITLSETLLTNPPKYKFISPEFCSCRIHPNLYKNGNVCIDILNTWARNNWTPMLTQLSILNTIRSLLDDNPLIHEPAKFENDDYEQYKIAAKFLNIKMAYDIWRKSSNIKNDFIREKIKSKFTVDKFISRLHEMPNSNIHYFHGDVEVDPNLLNKLKLT